MGQLQLGRMSPVECHMGMYCGIVICYIHQRSSQIDRFADDTKIYIHISVSSNSGILDAKLECPQVWSEKNDRFVFIHVNASPWNLECPEHSPSTQFGTAMA